MKVCQAYCFSVRLNMFEIRACFENILNFHFVLNVCHDLLFFITCWKISNIVLASFAMFLNFNVGRTTVIRFVVHACLNVFGFSNLLFDHVGDFDVSLCGSPSCCSNILCFFRFCVLLLILIIFKTEFSNTAMRVYIFWFQEFKFQFRELCFVFNVLTKRFANKVVFRWWRADKVNLPKTLFLPRSETFNAIFLEAGLGGLSGIRGGALKAILPAVGSR